MKDDYRGGNWSTVLRRKNCIDQNQSFELLRRLSSTTNVKLRDIATEIVETRTIPHERTQDLRDD